MDNDLINRNEAVQLLRAYADEVGCKRGEYELANGILKAVSFLLHDIPSSDKWISCRKYLPQNSENVLVCWGAGNRSVGYYISGGAGGWFFEQLAGGYRIPYEPYAWQPLPEEYKESKNEID